MSSRKRVWYEGAVYHVMGRGIRQMNIFRTEEDYELFLMLLGMIMKQIEMDVYSICLMSNHFHILLKTYDTEIWKIMSKLMHSYALNFNRRYGYKGHVFDSRYSSKLVEDDRYLLEVSRYIHLNPVKASMVRKPEDYPYSNYNLYSGLTCGMSEGLKFLQVFAGITETSRIESYFTHDTERQYREFVEGKASHFEQELQIRQDMGEDENWLPW